MTSLLAYLGIGWCILVVLFLYCESKIPPDPVDELPRGKRRRKW